MADSPEPTPLLLHSLAEFRDLILGCLDVVRPRTLVEVGGEGGAFTAALAEWAQGAGARVRCVEPAPSDAVRELPARFPGLELVEARSPEALRSFEPCDLYVLDGDHNHWTVLNELRTIAEHARSEPLVILHDVGWPCARRDFYYTPEALPAEAVRPHSFSDGAVPGRAELVHGGGYRGGGQMALAVEEGGPANGVLTAVEDFLAERPDLELAVVPCVFGLGLVFPREASYAERLRAVLAPYRDSALLRRLEDNRLTLLLKVLELDDRLRDTTLAGEARVRSYEEQLAALSAENARLRERIAVSNGGTA